MSAEQVLAARGAVFWPVGNGDSTTIVVDETVLLQIDLHDMAKADDEETPEIAVVDQLVDALPIRLDPGDAILGEALRGIGQQPCHERASGKWLF